jgi:hypothetical protein
MLRRVSTLVLTIDLRYKSIRLLSIALWGEEANATSDGLWSHAGTGCTTEAQMLRRGATK